MIIALYILIAALFYYMGYIMSLYSSVAFVEPEKLEEIIDDLSDFKKKYLNEIQDHPRLSIQLLTMFKSLILVVVMAVAVLMANKLSVDYFWSLDWSVIIGLIIVWVIYLIFVEILPSRRVLSLNNGNMRFLSFYISVYIFFKPLLKVYSQILNRETNDKISEDQKEDIIERAIETIAEQAGIDEPIVEDDEKEMIGQIFQLDVTEVREVMIPRIDIEGFNKTANLDEIRDVTREAGYSRYPVFDDSPDKVIGILYVKDLFTALTEKNETIDIMRYVREPFFVSEKKKISDLLAEFKSNKVHMAIVVDEYGGTSGLVTLEDILEEIVGEIRDEHDYGPDPVTRLPDSSLKVDATVSIEELLEQLNLDYETEDFETVGGVIYDLVGSVPAAGTTIRWKDIIFEVEKVEGQRILSVIAWVKKGTEL